MSWFIGCTGVESMMNKLFGMECEHWEGWWVRLVGVHMLEFEKQGIEVMEYQGSWRFWQVGKQGEGCRIWIPPFQNRLSKQKTKFWTLL